MTSIIEAFTTFITATGVNGSTALALVLSGGLVYFIRELIFKQREDTKAQIEASMKTAEAMDKIIHTLHLNLYTLVAELCQAKGIPMPRSGGAGK